MPRGLLAQDIAKGQKVPGFGDIIVTETLSASSTTEIIRIANPGEKLAWQCKDTLACSVEVSINGTDFVAAGTGAVSTISSFDTHPVAYVRVTRTGGEGKLVLVTR